MGSVHCPVIVYVEMSWHACRRIFDDSCTKSIFGRKTHCPTKRSWCWPLTALAPFDPCRCVPPYPASTLALCWAAVFVFVDVSCCRMAFAVLLAQFADPDHAASQALQASGSATVSGPYFVRDGQVYCDFHVPGTLNKGGAGFWGVHCLRAPRMSISCLA